MAKQAREETSQQRGLTQWRPFGEMGRWDRDMGRLVRNFFGGRAHPLFDERWWPAISSESQELSPDIDLYEDQNEIVVKAELPGMTKDDIQISLNDNILTIRGEKKKEEEDQGKDYYRSERVYGAFVRSLALPAEINQDKVRATFRNGVLEIRLPKSEQAKKKEIKVNVG
jgi:HSP20 family protein